ncbi:MAG: tRNA 2-thiouridine(34) synthase MnmA [Patescibacteria group bacterium]|jgi:tRNA-specific 2-thiouridylase
MQQLNKKYKVFIGLSGGVDSSVAAALLKEQGHDVAGVFIKIWQSKWGPCGWKNDRRDAMRVAMKLEIPFKELDLSDEYEKEVVDYMVREYKAGRTPNPDVMCNSQIKFGAFLKWAKSRGADYIATGHYARIKRISLKEKNIKYSILNIQLFQGVDKTKDQSYFLWQLKQSQLKHCLFPIGEYKKSEVRKMAKEFGLPTAEKKDSQGICFVGKVGMKEFLKKYIKAKPGNVLNVDGEIIGKHDGAVFYTIRQRHGFTITAKGVDDRPCYVVGKDIKKNTVTVGEQQIVNSKKGCDVVIHQTNWISGEPNTSKSYKARFRHLQKLLNCQIVKLLDDEYEIKFIKAQEGIASGQSLVLYDGEICLGGGIIKSNN